VGKEALKDLLPEAVIRKKKDGIGSPRDIWLKTQTRVLESTRDTLLSHRAVQRDISKAVESRCHAADITWVQQPIMGTSYASSWS